MRQNISAIFFCWSLLVAVVLIYKSRGDPKLIVPGSILGAIGLTFLWLNRNSRE